VQEPCALEPIEFRTLERRCNVVRRILQDFPYNPKELTCHGQCRGLFEILAKLLDGLSQGGDSEELSDGQKKARSENPQPGS